MSMFLDRYRGLKILMARVTFNEPYAEKSEKGVKRVSLEAVQFSSDLDAG